jgi:hypothetical protein
MKKYTKAFFRECGKKSSGNKNPKLPSKAARVRGGKKSAMLRAKITVAPWVADELLKINLKKTLARL